MGESCSTWGGGGGGVLPVATGMFRYMFRQWRLKYSLLNKWGGCLSVLHGSMMKGLHGGIDTLMWD